MADADYAAEVVRDIDRSWRSQTGDHFGFSVQVAIGAHNVPSGADIFVAWDYAKMIGKLVGWLGDVHWRSLAGTTRATAFPFVDPVAVSGPRSNFPRGCFPFYDVLATRPDQEFSPRDAYGEALWLRWCNVWRASRVDLVTTDDAT